MPQWDFRRSITSMRLLTQLALDLGMTHDEALAGTGLALEQLSDATMVVSAQQELRLIRNLVASHGDLSGLGILAGQRYHFTAFGALGFAIVSSRSIRSALDVALQYFHLTFAFTRFEVADTDDMTCVVLDDTEVPNDVAAFIVERDMSALITVARDLYDLEPMLSVVSFSSPAPADLVAYKNFFRLVPHFGTESNQVSFDREKMNRHLPQANELACASAVEQCRQLLSVSKVRHGLSATVRDKLVACPVEMPSMETIAGDLCMTVRTLRRQLLAEGASFTELRDEVRMTLAEEFLFGPKLSVQQVAERLGYAETTSFINAFKRWHGATPYAFKQKRRPVIQAGIL